MGGEGGGGGDGGGEVDGACGDVECEWEAAEGGVDLAVDFARREYAFSLEKLCFFDGKCCFLVCFDAFLVHFGTF